MADSRANFLLKEIQQGLGSSADVKSVQNDSALYNFLNDPDVNLLSATLGPNGKVDLSNVADKDDAGTNGIHFVKRQRGPLPSQNINEHVLVTSTLGSPLFSLYLAIHNVYAPKILGNDTQGVDYKLQQMLVDLEKGLHNAVVQKGDSSTNTDQNDVSGIRSIRDEYQFWRIQAGGNGHNASRAQAFVEHLENLANMYDQLTPSVNFDDARMLIEDLQDPLNALFAEENFSRGEQYSETRMKHLFELISQGIASYIKSVLADINIWQDPFLKVAQHLNASSTLCDTWITVSSDIQDWSRRWSDKRYRDEGLIDFQKRLNAILSHRSVVEELLRLLPRSDHAQFNLSTMFAPFDNISVLHTGPFAEPKWKATTDQFNRLLAPAESHAASLFKQRIFNLADRPQSLVGEFRNFPTLLLRPGISRQLASEFENLLAQLTSHIENIRNDFEVHSGDYKGSEPPTARNMSPRVSAVIWAHQLIAKLEQTHVICNTVLSNTNGIDNFSSTYRNIKNRVSEFAKEKFQTWRDQLIDQLRDKDDELVLQTSGTLMELDLKHDRQLVVHYSERLVTLLREVRQLSELGYSIPQQIQRTVETGEKYYRYGLKLKQVANFYNTMNEEIIPSQLSMLLSEASKFEAIVKDTRSATWDNPDSCERFMRKLMSAAEALTSRNRKLRSIHVLMANNIAELMGIDMITQENTWTDKFHSMKKILQREGRNSIGWRRHWDQQLYKAFEYQYRCSLERLSGSLISMPCDLVFTRKKLQFRPAIRDLRTKYYSKLKQFLDRPKTFSGFLGDSKGREYSEEIDSIYASIPERNAEGVYSVYKNAELLFEQLEQLKKTHEKWVVLGTVDLDEFVESRLTDVSHWEYNFKALKKRRKDSEKIPDTEKVGCFNVSLVPFKSSVDDLMQRFSDALMLSLRKSAGENLKDIDEYLNNAMEQLSNKPQSVEEMGAAKKEWKKIADKKGEYFRMLNMVFKKNSLLKQMANVSMELSSLKPRWESFLVALDAFTDMLEDQRDTLKAGIDKRVKDGLADINKFASRWLSLKPKPDQEINRESAEKILSEIKDWQDELKTLVQAAEALIADTESFDMPIPSFDQLDDVKAEIDSHQESWSLYSDYMLELEEMTKEDWLSFRTRILDFESLIQRWSKRTKGRARDAVCLSISQELKQFREVFPILRKVTGEMFENEHWRILFAKLKFPPAITTKTLNLGHFLKFKETMIKEVKQINNLAARAQGEVTIREAVQELKVWAEETEFELLEYKTDKSSTYLIKGWKDMFTKVSDQQSLVASLKESPYYAPFEDTSKQFEVKLSTLDICLHSLNQIQRKYVYLQPIFDRGALPHEQARFQRIDSDFRGIMDDVGLNPNVMALAGVDGLQDTVTTLLDQLDRCQRALNDFLEQKRSKLPRFYFIGDDDLLEILGQAQNPAVINNHLKKLFGGIHKVKFSDDMKLITTMVSAKGEEVPLLQPVLITSEVEDWLANLSVAMQETLAQMLIDCIKECDYQTFPSQILCLAELVSFTQRCERAISMGPSGLSQLHRELSDQLSTLTSTDASDDHLLDLKIKSLVLDLIHNIEVVELMQEKKVGSLDDWFWQKQLRFYINQQGRCIMRMTDAQFNYSYEYQGNRGKLVHTPLTDKCYLVLTQGMHLGYGGNPYGPAGTGKTESVKALGAAFGRQVLVFNCDEGIDFKSMGRIFTGLVKGGAWGCFDEFNRLKEDQLSAVSQQIQVIQAALKNGEPTCDLLGTQINVNPNAAIFVTMNPASREYGGRSKLPHNLKQLFRAVAMSVPDNSLIAKTILYSEGFQHATVLGTKLISVYDLARQLLSKQRHYDWGLRALKTVLRHGGQLIYNEKQKGNQLDLKTETKLLIGALRINTLSKLTFSDAIKFESLLTDVFSDEKVEEIDYTELENAIKEALQYYHLEVVDNQISKILQIHAALNQRMGVVVVGPSGCGKSVMLKVLHRALTQMGKTIKKHTMNPKALEREKLLGHMDHDTREWFDGVLTASARAVVEEPLDVHSWIICDGDIDPEWIESLNSVLDDNHLLTMPNGERIKFGDNVNFIFESHDLQHASPATISRMGMIFLSEEDVDVRSLVTSWLRSQDSKMQNNLMAWIDAMFYQALDYVMEDTSKQVTATTKVGIVNTALSHLKNVSSKGEFVCSLIRGMGSNLNIEDRTEFAKQIFASAGARPPDPRAPLDCFYNHDSKSLEQFTQSQQTFRPEEVSASDPPIMMTIDVQRNMKIIEPWIKRSEPFILVGPEGCGKTLLLTNAFRSLKSCMLATINCSSQTSANDVIKKIQSTCAVFSTNKGRVYRPKGADRLVLFLKDLNLPRPDEYDTIEMIALLQQMITYQGFYDGLEWVSVERVQIVGSMNPSTTVGRHELSTRFAAIAHLVFMTYPDKDQLQSIYTAFLGGVVRLSHTHNGKISEPIWTKIANIKKLCGTTVTLYEQLRRQFSPDDHRHYQFNPRDLTRWVCNLLRYSLSTNKLLDIWAYEACRLFGDRLVDKSAHKTFEKILKNLLRRDWNHDPLIVDIYYTASSLDELEDHKAVATDDIDEKERPAALREMGPLLTRVDSEQYNELIATGLHNYEREFRELHLQLFPEILDHMALEERVLSQPGGSLLLIGSSGVGRRTSITTIAFMHRIQVWSPNITLKYSNKNFRTDLKEVLRECGVEGKKTLLYLEDHQITEESILEDVNSLLSSGEVQGLYNQNEIEPMLQPLREEFENSGFGCRNVYEFFIKRIQQNLNVVVSMDPKHPKFRLRCERNPALFTKMTIAWMGEWTKQGLMAAPGEKLHPIFQAMQKTDSKIQPHQVMEAMIQVHQSCASRGNGTPAKFISFVNSYVKIFEKEQSEQQEKLGHLAGGLKKLQEAANTVDELTREATEKQARVARKQQEADQALEQITERMSEAGTRKAEVAQLSEQLSVESKKLESKQQAIKNELSEIEPVLQQAKKAVTGIKKDNLNEIRAFRMPPPAIRNVLAGVLLLMDQDDLSWQNMRAFLGRPSVKDEIIHFDAKNVRPSTRKKVQKQIRDSGDHYEHAVINRVNVAAAPLAAWVKANVKYSQVLEQIRPLTDALARANAGLDSSRKRLAECEHDLKALDDEVKQLKAKFARTTSEAETLKVELKKTTDVLNRAQTLLSKLGGEKGRWETQVHTMTDDLATLPISALLAAGFVTYLGGFDEGDRAELLAMWKQIVGRPDFRFMQFMATESVFLQWKAEGLPSDDLSMQNGLVINTSQQTPFIIDPSGQATEWLQETMKEKKLEVVQQQEKRFVNAVELAVRFGKTLVVLEVDGVLPMLFPLLRKDLVRQGPRWVIQIGDKTVDYNENFRLFLVTRNAHPTLYPSDRSMVSEVNFSITASGLQGQLLGMTLNNEKPELEAKKSEILAEEDRLKIQQAELERKLLQELAASEGNILENQTLIDSLNQTKEQSTVIAESLVTSQRLQADLDKQREVYRIVAKAGSTLYFLMAQLRMVNNMYNFSLEAFNKIFKMNLEAKSNTPAGDTKSRIRRLVNGIKLRIFRYVTRSLFKDDRLMFALHLIHKFLKKKFGPHEWEFFIGQAVPTKIDINSSEGKLPGWAPQARAKSYASFVCTFPNVARSLQFSDTNTWRAWMANPKCEMDFPQQDEKVISLFQRLLVVQALRPDRLQSAIQDFVCRVLQIKSVSPPPLALNQLLQESSASEPILFITSAGADPSQELEEFATQVVGKNGFQQLAMGSGQTDAAVALLEHAAKEGTWLCLKNLHLVTSWLYVLEKLLKSLNPHPKFRLWLTTEEHPNFPPILLQQSLKITYESPPGIKQNLLRTYEAWPAPYLAKGSVTRAQMLFILAWFHAIVQERRTYIPQGWTKYYEFSFADLRSAADIFDSIFSRINRNGAQEVNPNSIPWPTIHGLMEFAIYGGRIDNDHDVRILVTYLKKFFSPSMLGSGGRGPQERLTQGIELPFSNNRDDYMRIIQSIPDRDAPDTFCLAENIEGAVQESQSTNVLAQLRKLSASTGDSVRFDREAWRQGLGSLLTLWQQLRSANNKAILQRPQRVTIPDSKQTPIDGFVILEATAVQQLIVLVDNVLSDMHNVVFNGGPLSPLIESDGNILMTGETPWRWAKHWLGPEEPSKWVREVCARRNAMDQWLSRAQSGDLLNQPVNLSQLFRPRTFLNAFRQQTARTSGIPIDQLELTCAWDRMQLPSGTSLRVEAVGMYVQGCSFVNNQLGALSADSPVISELPTVYLCYKDKKAPEPYPGGQGLAVPVYFSPTREEFICELRAPCPGQLDRWILSGVAFYLTDVK